MLCNRLKIVVEISRFSKWETEMGPWRASATQQVLASFILSENLSDVVRVSKKVASAKSEFTFLSSSVASLWLLWTAAMGTTVFQPPLSLAIYHSFAAALSPFYHPVKVVPAHPGRRRSTALAQP